MVLVGSLTWALTTLGSALSWRVLVLQGGAMHLGLILGALVGIRIESAFDLIAVPLSILTVPLVAMLLVSRIEKEDRPPSLKKITALEILSRIWRPGLVLALATTLLASTVFLLVPVKAAEYWRMPWSAFGALVLGNLCARISTWHWPGRRGGGSLLVISLGIEACGQASLLTATGPVAQLPGTFLTGLGYSLIFPILGMAVLRRLAPDSHDRTIGGYSAFQDLAIGIVLPATAVALASLTAS
ncbi:hypothetical protein CQ12_39795 [Bradyrhizobium jicamae]|uniref:Major facilitator superfamily (MFS) profile domain-containing protein n=2 Tax=Bradyrhizobium jicamae TaxID=280332 RepID=A0A0R3M4W5_9BRAD|nr:hypothetical protein [Bradyrhizobium jicamae]KRR12304.1 hypothetical protein CQ12_39795 [Bradyrhizobium jicamae]